MKDKFISIYKQNIYRSGSDELLDWLQDSDFFTAPASTRYHLSEPGGLVAHSVHVYERLRKEYIFEFTSMLEADIEPLPPEIEETIAICGLLHDICKANFYKTEWRNTKNEIGMWVKAPYYAVDDMFPYGHGEKSAYLVSKYMKLSDEEAIAIRWHMGGFDDAVKSGSLSMNVAYDKFPIAVLLHFADMKATYFDERQVK